MMKFATLALGYSFLGLGVIGLFVPILQGVLFIVAGLVILSRHAAWARRSLERMKGWHPRAGRIIGRAESLSRRWLRVIQVRVSRLLRYARS